MRFSFFNSVLVIFVVVGLVGCDKLKVTPVTLDGETIVGYWFGANDMNNEGISMHQRLYLHVKDDGHVRYVSLVCGTTNNLGAKQQARLELDYMALKRMTSKKMILQNYPLTPKFELTINSLPDHERDEFVLDQVSLQRIAKADAPDTSGWQCD